jgi:hypothetical protein
VSLSDVAGNDASAGCTFTVDTTTPTIVTISPGNNENDVDIGTVVQVTFSEAMDRSSVESAFSLAQGATDISGDFAWGYGDTMVIFTPTSDFAYSTTYAITIGTGARDLAGNSLVAQSTASFTTIAEPDTTAPTVDGVSPGDGTSDVSISTTVVVTFSEEMATSLTNGAFSLKQGVATVSGSFHWNSARTAMTFTPDSDLLYSTTYTVTIGTGACDPAANSLASAFTSSFTTTAAPDTTAPTVTDVLPADGANSVSIGTTISMTFSEAMSESSASEPFSLAPTVGGSYLWTSSTVCVFTPTSSLPYGTEYSVSVNAGLKDLAGNAVQAFTSIFTSEAQPDTTNPVISAIAPEDGALVTTSSPTISASFSDDVSGVNSNSASIKVDDVDITSSATVSSTGFSYVASSLTDGMHSVSVSISDAAGNPASLSWTFTVDATDPSVQGVVPDNGASGVAIDGTVQVTFSEPMSTSTVENAFSLNGGSAVIGTFAWNSDNSVMTFTPTSALAYGTTYTVSIGVGASDPAGNTIHAFSSSFTTTVAPDITPPSISGYVDGQQITDIAVTPTVGASFADSQSGIDASRTIVMVDGVDVTASATISATGFTYPTNLLGWGGHTVSVTVYDLAGNSATASWSVQVIKPDTTPPAIKLSYTYNKKSGTCTISATITDKGGFDKSSVKVLIDGVEVTSQCTWSGSKITYQGVLRPGTHTIVIQATDLVGNQAQVTKLIAVPPR